MPLSTSTKQTHSHPPLLPNHTQHGEHSKLNYYANERKKKRKNNIFHELFASFSESAVLIIIDRIVPQIHETQTVWKIFAARDAKRLFSAPLCVSLRHVEFLNGSMCGGWMCSSSSGTIHVLLTLSTRSSVDSDCETPFCSALESNFTSIFTCLSRYGKLQGLQCQTIWILFLCLGCKLHIMDRKWLARKI